MFNHFNEVPYDLLVNLGNDVERTIEVANSEATNQLESTLTKRRVYRRQLYKTEELFVRDDPLQLSNLPESLGNRKIVKLRDDLFFAALVGNQRIGTILLTNNDFARALSYDPSLLQRTPSNFLVGWDIDSHHWISNSIRFATYVDCYFPAQFSNLELYRRLFGDSVEPIPLGSVQWSLEQLNAFAEALCKPRLNSLPLGVHGFYQRFHRRNFIVSQWNKASRYCLLSSDLTSYSSLSAFERLAVWTGTTTHLIAPVNEDLPFRFFDGLITQSCLLTPFSLKKYVDMLNLDVDEEKLIVYYKAGSLTVGEMNRLIEIGRDQWEQVNAERRGEQTKDFDLMIKRHHVSKRIETMVKVVDETMHEDQK